MAEELGRSQGGEGGRVAAVTIGFPAAVGVGGELAVNGSEGEEEERRIGLDTVVAAGAPEVGEDVGEGRQEPAVEDVFLCRRVGGSACRRGLAVLASEGALGGVEELEEVLLELGGDAGVAGLAQVFSAELDIEAFSNVGEGEGVGDAGALPEVLDGVVVAVVDFSCWVSCVGHGFSRGKGKGRYVQAAAGSEKDQLSVSSGPEFSLVLLGGID